ncbi:MAG: recombinase family protein [Clostridiales bacterium]|nr:recombinase family protein [Clostridiales bacterium]
MANIAYVRVSTADQNDERQRQALSSYQIDEWFSEKVSGKDTNRPKLQEMLRYARKGDTVYVHDFSRLARSTSDLLKIVEELHGKNVQVISLKENFDTSTPTGRLMLTMMAAIAEFERDNILERQREGIAIAKAAGKYRGRNKIEVPNFKEYYELYMKRKLNKSDIAKKLKISRPTVDRLIREWEEGFN